MARKKKLPHYVEPQQLSLFYTEFITDPNLRDDRDVMSYPFLSLQKRKRTKPIHFEDKKTGVKIDVTGSNEYGIATIFDYDFILWLVSIINEGIEAGHPTTPIIRFQPYQFLVQAGWITEGNKGGKGYNRLFSALQRLQSTSIFTTIPSPGNPTQSRGQWSWIDRFYWYENAEGKKMDHVEIRMSDWLYERIIKNRTVLAIHQDYFSLTKGLEKWMYRIARRHCGNQESIKFTVQGLFRRYPTQTHFRQFKHVLRRMLEDIKRRENAKDTDEFKNSKEVLFPEYLIEWHETQTEEYIVIAPKPGSREERRLPRHVRGILPRD